MDNTTFFPSKWCEVVNEVSHVVEIQQILWLKPVQVVEAELFVLGPFEGW